MDHTQNFSIFLLIQLLWNPVYSYPKISVGEQLWSQTMNTQKHATTLDERWAPVNKLHLRSVTLCLFTSHISDSFLPQEKQYKGTRGRFLPTTTQKVLYPKPSFLPSSIQSCPTAADTPATAGMKGLPGLACTPSISFLAGGEMLSAFHLCKRSYMTMSFHQIWFQNLTIMAAVTTV